MDISKYVKKIIEIKKTGVSSEHSFRGTLEALLQEEVGVRAINEPSNINFGKPDFECRYNGLPFGYIECKDFGIRFNENTEQFQRYLNHIDTLLWTDYNVFILYKNKTKLFETKVINTEDLQPIKKNYKELENLLNYFINSAPIPISSADKLAERLAENAKIITKKIIEDLESNGENSQLFDIYNSFTENLISNLKYNDFAQMMAQTVCYGLFAAKYNQEKIHDYDPDRPREFTRTNACVFLPNTNKSLKELFGNISSDNFFEGIKWVADDVVRILNNTDMACVLNKFGESEDNDPIIHFYETFLNKYDPEYKKSLGVFYTPRPVVDYIIKSVDYVLREEFGEELGLASDKKENGEYLVQILDPATGTGAFLTDIISNIHRTVKNKLGDVWSDYVRDNLLERLNAFEIMMAPYTIAHINVAQQLSELGYDLTNDKPLNIVLADTLQEPENTDHLRIPFMPGLTKEIKTANTIKEKKKIMVICGNPPYAVSSANKDNKYICDLVSEEYYPKDDIKEKNPKVINDDYVKFIRFAQDKLNQTDKGILGFITNNGYLTNPTFRRMRQSLMKTFNKIYIVNLHGNSLKKETAPDGSKDENVFDIRVGTSIIIGVRNTDSEESFVKYKDLYGLRKEKYYYLRNNSAETSDFETVTPQKPFYMFSSRDIDLENTYNKYWSVKDIMKTNNNAIETHKDNLSIDFDKEKLWKRITDLKNLECEAFREKYNVGEDGSEWKLSNAKINVTEHYSEENIKEITYRPFDTRYIYYLKNKGIIARPRNEIMKHLLKENVCFLLSRESGRHGKGSNIILVSDKISEKKTNSYDRSTQVFPFYLYNESEGLDIEYEEKVPNLDDAFCRNIAEKTGLKYVPECDENKLINLNENEFAPRHVFNYIYGLLSGTAYREKYMQFIDTDFPRIPLPKNRDLFLKVGEFGNKLINLHLMKESLSPNNPFKGTGDNNIDKRKFENHRVYINKDQYFDNVSEEAWNYNMGGYQVLDKYLKDRKDRENNKLTYEEIRHYQNIISVITKTLELTKEYDNYIKEQVD